MTAPIAIIALGFWGARFREEKWPSQPRIVECRVRAATPLEISKGANIAVEVRALVPNTAEITQASPMLDFSLRSRSDGAEQMSSWSEGRFDIGFGNRELIQSYSYNLKRDEEQSPFNLKVKLRFLVGKMVPVTRRFEISAKDIALPNVAYARRNNFRVAKAMLFAPVKIGGTTDEEIILDIVDVSSEFPNAPQTAHCPGNWVLQDSGVSPLSIGSSIQQSDDSQILKVKIHLNYYKRRALPKPGAKIRGQISINRGWPQEITFEWPKISAKSPALTEVKFSTKLAPLPK